MRHVTRNLVVLILILNTLPALPSAAQTVELVEGQSLDVALADARRSLEIAKIEMRLYIQTEYPRQRRHLDAEIRLVTAENDVMKVRVREYKSFHRSRYSMPFLTSLQESELALLDSKLRLKDLREERSALQRFHSDNCRLRELRVEAARARVVALDRLRNGP